MLRTVSEEIGTSAQRINNVAFTYHLDARLRLALELAFPLPLNQELVGNI